MSRTRYAPDTARPWCRAAGEVQLQQALPKRVSVFNRWYSPFVVLAAFRLEQGSGQGSFMGFDEQRFQVHYMMMTSSATLFPF